MDLVGADVPPPAPRDPWSAAAAAARGKQERSKESGLGLGLGLAQVLAWNTCPETPELPHSLSRHPPESTSLNLPPKPKPRHAWQALGGSVASLPWAVF